jgi:hypothetical protein
MEWRVGSRDGRGVILIDLGIFSIGVRTREWNGLYGRSFTMATTVPVRNMCAYAVLIVSFISI